MSYTRRQVFEPGAFLRDCDICGIRYRSTDLARGEDGFWRCRRWCQEVPAIVRDRLSAESQRRREAPPPKWGKPYDQKYAYAEEAEAFAFLVEMPVRDAAWPGGIRLGAAPTSAFNNPFGVPVGTTTFGYTYSAVHETCRYLYALIVEGKRPATWIALAKAKLRELADWLLGKQNLTGTADTNMAFGGFDDSLLAGGSVNYTCFDQAGCGLALVNAFQVLGDSKYIVGARNTANMVRAFQWSDQAAQFPTASNSAGTSPLHTGGHSSFLQFFAGFGGLLFSSIFQAQDLLAVEFLSALKAVDGDATYGGLGVTGPQSFVTTSAALLSTMIAEALAFWQTGTLDAVLGTTLTGLSASTPKEKFNAFPANKGDAGLGTGTGAWEYFNGNSAAGTTISSLNVSRGLRSLFAVSGFTAQINAVWSWLMGFTSNPAFVGPANTLPTDFAISSTRLSANLPAVPTGQGNIVAPSYNPKLTLAQTLLVRDSANGFAAIAMNGSSIYDWQAAGNLAAIQSSQDAGAMRKAKDAMTTYRLRDPITFAPNEPISETVLMRSVSGLSYQTGVGLASISSNVANVARCAAVFRYSPSAFTGTGRPDKTQPGASPGTLQVQT